MGCDVLAQSWVLGTTPDVQDYTKTKRLHLYKVKRNKHTLSLDKLITTQFGFEWLAMK